MACGVGSVGGVGSEGVNAATSLDFFAGADSIVERLQDLNVLQVGRVVVQ